MRRPEILLRVADRVRLIGVTQAQIEAAAAAQPLVSWRRLPLFTDLVLDGEPLQPLLEFRCTLSLDAFAEAYEEFIAGFFFTGEYRSESAQLWARKRFQLSKDESAQLFQDTPQPGRRSVHPRLILRMTLALAALAQYTYDGALEHDATRFVVDTGKWRFGVAEGRPISKWRAPRGGERTPLYCKRGLAHYGREGVFARQSPRASLLAGLHAWAVSNPELLTGEAEGFMLALHLLWWRAGDANPLTLQHAILNEAALPTKRQALRLAAGFEALEDPYPDLRALLVPVVMTSDEFIYAFGRGRSGQRLSPERQMQWRIALDNLAEELREAA